MRVSTRITGKFNGESRNLLCKIELLIRETRGLYFTFYSYPQLTTPSTLCLPIRKLGEECVHMLKMVIVVYIYKYTYAFASVYLLQLLGKKIFCVKYRDP